jgi:hypothetical protein
MNSSCSFLPFSTEGNAVSHQVEPDIEHQVELDIDPTAQLNMDERLASLDEQLGSDFIFLPSFLEGVLASLSPVYVYIKPTDKDVLLGRGGHAAHHPGNSNYLRAKATIQARYSAATKTEKMGISQELVDIVREWGGRFLKRHQLVGKWYEVENEVARKKASQTLRETSTPKVARKKASQTLRETNAPKVLATRTGAARHPVHKDSFGSLSSAAVTTAAVRPHQVEPDIDLNASSNASGSPNTKARKATVASFRRKFDGDKRPSAGAMEAGTAPLALQVPVPAHHGDGDGDEQLYAGAILAASAFDKRSRELKRNEHTSAAHTDGRLLSPGTVHVEGLGLTTESDDTFELNTTPPPSQQPPALAHYGDTGSFLEVAFAVTEDPPIITATSCMVPACGEITPPANAGLIGRAPHMMRCPHCAVDAVAHPRSQIDDCTVITAVLLLFVFWPVFWIPFVVPVSTKQALRQ